VDRETTRSTIERFADAMGSWEPIGAAIIDLCRAVQTQQ